MPEETMKTGIHFIDRLPPVKKEHVMRKFLSNPCAILCLLFSIFVVPAGFSQESPDLEISDTAICENVESHTCIDAKEEYSQGVEKLYCFTRINGAQEDTEVTHVWYYGEVERARIPLQVRSARYRTYSSKRIQPHETGDWHVDVLGPDDKVLKTIPFKIVQ